MAYSCVTPFTAYRTTFIDPLAACIISQCLVFALHLLNMVEAFDALLIFYPLTFGLVTVFLYVSQHIPLLVWSVFLASLHMDMLYMHVIGVSACTSYAVIRFVSGRSAWPWWQVAALSMPVALIALAVDQMTMRICLWFLTY